VVGRHGILQGAAGKTEVAGYQGMINEVARMEFQSASKPAQKGALVLTEDGFFQVDPSAEFLDELTRLEDQAVHGARTRGNLLGGLLVGAGLIVLALAWVASRMGGEMRETLTLPRPAEEVEIATDSSGAVQVTLPGVGPQRVQLTWEAGEINSEEAARFVAMHRQYKENIERNAR